MELVQPPNLLLVLDELRGRGFLDDAADVVEPTARHKIAPAGRRAIGVMS